MKLRLEFLLISAILICSNSYASTAAREVTNTGKYLAVGYAMRNNDPSIAAELTSKALESSPDNMFFLHDGYESALLIGDNKKAVNLAKKYASQNPGSAFTDILLSVDSSLNNDYPSALKYIDEIQMSVLTLDATAIDFLISPFIKLWINVGAGNTDKALAETEEAIKSKKANSLFAEYQYALINDYIGNTEKAEAAYDSIIMQSPTNYHFIKSAGNFYERIGKSEKAENLYKVNLAMFSSLEYFKEDYRRSQAKEVPQPVIKNPTDGIVEVLMEAARILYKNDYYNEGAKYLRLALYISPSYDEANALLASYYEETDDYEKAVSQYEKLDKKSDFYFSGNINMAEDLYHLGNKWQAKKKFYNLAEKNTYTPLIAYADLLRRDSQFKDAAEVYDEVIKSISKKEQQHWSIFFARGICYERTGNWKNAENDFLTALTLKPSQPEVLNYLGYSWIDRNQNIEKAKTMIELAVQARPDDAQILDSMGWALFKLKDFDRASLYLEKAVTIIPYDAVLNDHLGDIYWRQGRQREALFQWKRAVQYGADSKDISVDDINKKIKEGLPALESPVAMGEL